MRNEYTDYIAHGHKYFAVIDLGKKNSKGSKLRRYFYSANEYKAYLQGKKTTDDKLLGAASKAYNKVKGLSAVSKALPKLAKAAKETSKMTEGEKTDKNVETRAKRAGLTVNTNKKLAIASDYSKMYNDATDEKGNHYLISRDNRKIYSHDGKPYGNGGRVITNANEGKGKDESKDLIKKENQAKKERNKPSDIFRRTVKVPDQGPAITKLTNKVGEVIDKTVGAKVREDITERLIEKGINKANAEAMRKKLEETYERATKIGESANNLKGRLDKLQEAFTSGDGDKALDAIDETLKDQEAIQKDILTIVDEMLPEAKNVADTFLDMGKKTLDTATAGPKAVVGGDAVDEYLKEHGMSKDDVSKEFLEELKENLKKNRK